MTAERVVEDDSGMVCGEREAYATQVLASHLGEGRQALARGARSMHLLFRYDPAPAALAQARSSRLPLRRRWSSPPYHHTITLRHSYRRPIPFRLLAY